MNAAVTSIHLAFFPQHIITYNFILLQEEKSQLTWRSRSRESFCASSRIVIRASGIWSVHQRIIFQPHFTFKLYRLKIYANIYLNVALLFPALCCSGLDSSWESWKHHTPGLLIQLGVIETRHSTSVGTREPEYKEDWTCVILVYLLSTFSCPIELQCAIPFCLTVFARYMAQIISKQN